jgi:chemotaxis protein methyltransferase CheR
VEAGEPIEPFEFYRFATHVARRSGLPAARTWVDTALAGDVLLAPAHYLSALILLEDARPEDALEALRRAVFADPNFVLGHVALAGVASRLGQRQRARRALASVERLLAGMDSNRPVPEGLGLTVGELRELVALQMSAPAPAGGVIP